MVPQTNHKQIDEEGQAQLKEMVKERPQMAIRITLIQVLEEEIEGYIRAAPYQRTAERQDYRNGTYERDLDTSMGSIKDLPVPRTRNGYRTELFGRYQRRQAELDEAICNMFVKGISQAQVGNVVEALSGVHPSASTMSRVFHSLEADFDSWLWHCGLRISEVCSLLVNDVDLPGRKLFIRNSKKRKDRMVYLSETSVEALHHHLASRPDPSSAYLFTTRFGVLKRGGLWKKLRSYGHQCGVQVTARRLRHTFASQMLAAGMPISSLQRYLGHELMDTTMIYAEVSNPLLQQDYYRGITTIDPQSANLAHPDMRPPHQAQLRRLISELKIPDLEPIRQKEILE
jgi:hypothetical protein